MPEAHFLVREISPSVAVALTWPIEQPYDGTHFSRSIALTGCSVGEDGIDGANSAPSKAGHSAQML